jgi:hypothetical protein
MKHLLQSALGGFIITLLSSVLPLLAWPVFIFDPLFPPECGPEVAICMFSGKALAAAALSQLIIYTLLSYAVLRLRLICLRRVEYTGLKRARIRPGESG